MKIKIHTTKGRNKSSCIEGAILAATFVASFFGKRRPQKAKMIYDEGVVRSVGSSSEKG